MAAVLALVQQQCTSYSSLTRLRAAVWKAQQQQQILETRSQQQRWYHVTASLLGTAAAENGSTHIIHSFN